MMPHKRDFTEAELFPMLSTIAKGNNTAIVVGVQERHRIGSNTSTIWFINEKGEMQGKLNKFALPRYDHIAAHGSGNVSPESDMFSRFKVFKLHDLYVSAVFCWEVYSDLLWTGLSIQRPDVVFNMIKFGVNAWPTVKKVDGINTVLGFGYGRWAEYDDGGWIERLHVANKWQVKCPIICSTNGWNLNPRSLPLAGMISDIPGQAEPDIWYPKKEDKLKEIPEKIVISEVNEQAVRGVLKNKWAYLDAVGELPPMDIGKFTMYLKINRIESRALKSTARLEERKVHKVKNMFNQ